MRSRKFVLLAIILLLSPWSYSQTGEMASIGHSETEATGESSVSAPGSAHPTNGHEYPVTPLLLGVSVILLAAKIAGDLMVRVKQPAVLGELLVGALLGNVI